MPTEEKKVKQESFNAHFAMINHNGEDDWEVRLINQTDNVEDLRKRESFWQHKLDTFQPNGNFFSFNYCFFCYCHYYYLFATIMGM